MDPAVQLSQLQTRRQFCSTGGRVSIGVAALATLLNSDTCRSETVNSVPLNGMHFPARAKNGIYMFQAGGPAQMEL